VYSFDKSFIHRHASIEEQEIHSLKMSLFPLSSIRHLVYVTLSVFLLGACTGTPDNVTVVKNFELDRYLGTWHEIARLDHSFERDLSNVTANYSLRDDGGVKVINKGFNEKSGEWESAEGKAYFVGEADVGKLKVSFFGPFYGGYNIMALDKEGYSYSLVCGPNYSYLWILARKPSLPEDVLKQLIQTAEKAGFPVDDLIFVEHGKASLP
jgi:apolipoprotein D and lipocalin family protein